LQGLLQQDLAGRVVGQVFAPHHMGDALRGVVDDHGQLVGPQAIGTQQHKVAYAARHVLLLRSQAPVGPVQAIGCY